MPKGGRDVVQPPGATVQESSRPHRFPSGSKPWRWAVPREDLKRLLAQGLGPSEIARQYGLNHSTVSRAIRALEHQDLVAVVLGNRCQPNLPEVPPPALDAPIDVMGEVMGVIEDIRVMRAWLDSDEGRSTLKTPTRLNYTLALFDKRLRWAETFVATRSKLLELITVEVWLQEMLAIIEEEAPGAKARILDRIRARIIGREIPAQAELLDTHPEE
jgi:hypothetical protein